MGSSWLAALLLAVTASTLSGASPTLASTSPSEPDGANLEKASIEEALAVIEAASTGSLGEACATGAGYKSLLAALDPRRYDTARQKADMAAMMLQDLGVAHHSREKVPVEGEGSFTLEYELDEILPEEYNGGHDGFNKPSRMSTELWSAALLDAVSRSLLASVEDAVGARVVALNASTGVVVGSTWWERAPGGVGEPLRSRDENHALQSGARPDPKLPWFEDADTSPGLRSPKFMQSPPIESYRGWWTLPYFSCKERRWLISYSVSVPPPNRHGVRDFLSMDVDVSDLEVNQCNLEPTRSQEISNGNQIASFRGTHKCHNTTQCEYQSPGSRTNGKAVGAGWMKGAYVCRCRPGYYTAGHHQSGFNGTLVEAAWKELKENKTDLYERVFRCLACAPGCSSCRGPEPCLATYNWPFRITLLAVSVFCAFGTVILVGYMYQHRKLKVFKVASPIFLSITLLGCAIMYLEMAAIFPVLDIYSCIATKWSRHLGFCITYTALLMKTWRVSLTYRVKSAHKVKLTDKQLLQWMVPILLVMLIYLGTWTLSAPPIAEVIADSHGLLFNQCSFNWWDHSMAIGEVFFLAWGIKVCYNVRNAESLFNEARLISYAIYNIAVVNTAMVAIHLFIFPQAGPDIKYLLGFVRTQLSTSVTVFLVFGPKVLRVLRGQGDQWDSRARGRAGVSASFSLNGIGLVPEEAADLSQENEELKEEIQKLAAQIEFMKIVHMEMHNRHIKPKAGGYFSTPGHGHPSSGQSPIAKSSTASFILKAQHFCQSAVERGATAAAAAAVEDSTFPSGSLQRARRREMRKERERERERESERERERIERAEKAEKAERAERAEKVERDSQEQAQKSGERV